MKHNTIATNENATFELWRSLRQLFRREWLLSIRTPSQWVHPMVFFVMVVALFPLGISPDAKVLSSISVGVIWIAALLASMLGADRLFSTDFESGMLEQMALGSIPLFFLVQIKIINHWIFSGLALLCLTPFLALLLSAPPQGLPLLLVTLLLGTPVLVFINAIGAAVTIAAQGSSILLLLICLPLQIPVILFSTGAVKAYIMGLPFQGQLAMLGVLFFLFVFLSPFVIAGAVRIGLQGR